MVGPPLTMMAGRGEPGRNAPVDERAREATRRCRRQPCESLDVREPEHGRATLVRRDDEASGLLAKRLAGCVLVAQALVVLSIRERRHHSRPEGPWG